MQKPEHENGGERVAGTHSVADIRHRSQMTSLSGRNHPATRRRAAPRVMSTPRSEYRCINNRACASAESAAKTKQLIYKLKLGIVCLDDIRMSQ